VPGFAGLNGDRGLAGVGSEGPVGVELPVDALERITVALEVTDLLGAQLAELGRDLRALARRQTSCQGLMAQYGMGEISWLVTLCELGSSPGRTPPAKLCEWPALDPVCWAGSGLQVISR